MATLYRRATPAQHIVLRVIEGAVKNTTDAHPHLKISPRYRRSIAKRAAGTLTALWPEVLAARMHDENVGAEASESGGVPPGATRRRRSSHYAKAAGRGACETTTRSPLRLLRLALAKQLRPLKDAGQTERAEAFIAVLRMIAALEANAS